MGNNSSQLDYTKTSKTSYQLLEECRWKKPEYIIGELYQIEICDADASQIMRGHYNKKIIEEIFFPQFNVAVNQVRGYNIIPDAYSRFSNSKYPNSEPSKLIKKIKIDDCEELFDMICIGIKAKNLEGKVARLFEQINSTNS